MSKNKYVDLAKVGTNYSMRMNRLSNRIFGEVTRETKPKSMKVVKLFSEVPINKRPEIVKYYPRHPQTGWLMRNLRLYGLFRDEHEDFKEECEEQRALRGKGKKQRWQAILEKKGVKLRDPDEFVKKRFTEDF